MKISVNNPGEIKATLYKASEMFRNEIGKNADDKFMNSFLPL